MVGTELIFVIPLEYLTRHISLLVSLSDTDFVNRRLIALRDERWGSLEVVSMRLVVMLVD